jgi:hypothetical protein
MFNWSNRWNVVWQRSQKIGCDSLLLMSELAQSPRLSREILLRQAREANTVATSFLSMEREVNLVRYHGLVGYLRERSVLRRDWLQRLPFGSSQNTPKATHEQNMDNSNNATIRYSSTTARVPFMITAAQRASLANELGYSIDQIKQLKPLEASLILEHSIVPSELESRLPSLVDDCRASLENQRQMATMAPPVIVEKKSHDNQSSLPEYQLEEGEGATMVSLPAMPSTSERTGLKTSFAANARLWHQVVAITPDGIESVGIYPNESEARLCQETKAHLAAKHSPHVNVRFEVRTTHR